MLEKKIYISSNDVDASFNLKISSFFKMMQDAASDNAEELNIGHTRTNKDNRIWVITRFYVEINKLPKFQDEVILKTYPGETLRFVFSRYFELKDLKGNTLIRASSTWLVLDRETRKICLRPFEENIKAEQYGNELPLPDKVIVPSDLFHIEDRKVRYSDIDSNGHLNNTKYIDYILDINDSNFYLENKIKSLLINYNHEIKDGEIVSIYSSKSSPLYVKGDLNDLNSFEVMIEFEK